MRIGVTVERFGDVEPAQLVRLARLFGVEMVELNRSCFDNVLAVASNLGPLRAGLHLPFIGQDGFDFSCPAYQSDIDAVIDAVNTHCQRLHLQYALGHPPESAEASTEVETSEEVLIDNLSRLDLPIVLENVPSWDQEAFWRLYEKARAKLGSHLHGICLDAAHVFLRGEDPVARFRAWSAETKVIHLSDCSATEDLHLPLHSGGVLPVDDFLTAVRKERFDGALILEIQPPSLQELRPVVQSYLYVQRRLKPAKYLAAKAHVAAAALRLRITGLPSSERR